MGRFEGSDFLIDTVGFKAGVLTPHPGLLHSDAMRIVERLSLSEDGSELRREYAVTDPLYLQEPVTGTNSWRRTDLPLTAYNCTELSGVSKIRPDTND